MIRTSQERRFDFRVGLETYANQEISEILCGSDERVCRELDLQSKIQKQFEGISSVELQSHFSHFFLRARIIERLKNKAPSNENKEELKSCQKVNSLIVAALIKSLQDRGIRPLP